MHHLGDFLGGLGASGARVSIPDYLRLYPRGQSETQAPKLLLAAWRGLDIPAVSLGCPFPT